MTKNIILTSEEENERFVEILIFDVKSETINLKEAVKNAISDYLKDKKLEKIYFNWWDVLTHNISSYYFEKYGVKLIENDDEMVFLEDFKENLNKNMEG